MFTPRQLANLAKAKIPGHILAETMALRNHFLLYSSSAAAFGNAAFSTSRRNTPGRRTPSRSGQSGGTRNTSRTNENHPLPSQGQPVSNYGAPIPRVKSIEELVVPVAVSARSPQDSGPSGNVGTELVGEIPRNKLLEVLNQFPRRPNIRKVCEERGLSDRLFHQAFISFRQFCVASASSLPPDLHVLISDISRGNGSVDDLLPHFMKHARKVYPHLDCMDDLKQISDLRLPHNWYPEARSIQRKIIFHAGPTNSGKTFSALERYANSKSGVYCGPLKLLASEVYHKTNNAGVKCDLITGEERRYASENNEPSPHVACTVEMLGTSIPYEVAVIDEIQMLRDVQRGWAWTRALLGVFAEEVHLCGETAAVDLVKELLYPVGEEVEVRHYKRMTPLKILDQAVEKFENFQPGDCCVAFSKNDIFHISRQLEARNMDVAVIYGGLPPGTKLAQANLFNDVNSPCKVMVATDAIGMGINLSIKRVIFYSLTKPTLTETGETEMELLSTSQALQIAGRAGRYGTAYETGEVTTFRKEDLPKLKRVLDKSVGDIEQAGLHPTVEQIEMFAYYLPNATLSNLIDIFISLCNVDESKYFLCHMEDFKFLADMIQQVNLPLRTKYTFCLAPISRKQPFVCGMFLRFARQFSRGEPLTWEWLCGCLGWPFTPPETIVDLMHLEGVFDVMDMYLWLGYRFVDMFPDMALVRDMQAELDCIIQEGVKNITKLLKNTETTTSSGISSADPDFQEFTRKRKRDAFLRTTTTTGPVDAVDTSTKPTAEKSKSANAKNSIDVEEFFGDDVKDKPSVGEKVRVGHGMLTRRLIDQGLLTPDMVEQLKQEFLQSQKRKNDEDKDK